MIYEQNSITRAVAAALENVPHTTTAFLCRRLKKKTHELRAHYAQAMSSSQQSAADEWLCDNYYVLEKESKQSVRDIRALARRAPDHALILLYHVVRHVLFTLMPRLNDESITDMLCALGNLQPVSEQQFSMVPVAIKAFLIELAHHACLKSGDDKQIAYAITGISKLNLVDMDDIIQHCSRVEEVLSQDPAGVYRRMSDESRQHYRRLIAQLAYKTHRYEEDVAKEMLATAQNAQGFHRHIGYPILNHPILLTSKRRRGRLALLSNAILPLILSIAAGFWSGRIWLAVLSYLPLYEALRTLIQQLALTGIDVDFIPRMDLELVEEKPKTVVLVSTLLPKASDAPRLAERLEQLYFSNSDPDMYFCILADFKEWDFPSDEKDESQISASRKVIQDLNARYDDRFMFFLRNRVYSRTQKKYSGWERKRGAITEFIRFLKGKHTSVHTFIGDRSVLPEIRFIIALDADTNLLYESAQTLVAAAMHPLNRPVWNQQGIVVEGYGVLTPKISTDLESAKATAFSRVMSGCGGVTAYDTRDKDFYQDLFGEGIFAGKGLLDVDSFYTLLNDRFPENQILSHDILEGAYLRTGFVSDVEMTDGAPTSLTGWLARLHRWLRGDWQNIFFLKRHYRANGQVYENPIRSLDRFKLFDNLRRSLTPVASLACFISALFLPRPYSYFAVLVGFLAVSFASLWSALWALLTGGMFTLSRKFFTRTLPHTFELLAQAVLLLIMLPAQTLTTLDAVFRALWRSFVTRRNMLEWTTAAQSDSRRITVGSIIRRYWLAELIGLCFLIFATKDVLFLFGIVFSLLMPVAYYTARRTPIDRHTLTSTDRDTLLSYNAAMWRYYEDFANVQNHYLPPDNIQQSPVYRVAHRTSPTNIGMMLLSVLAARDFDFIDTNGMYTRIARTLSTVEKLPTWHGNLYNWYDTLTLETLKPEFVSTVDSGNFITCLVALKEGLREFLHEKPAMQSLIDRIEALIEATDLTPFYDKRRHLFTIGWDADSEELSGSYYDFLMSEARLTSYYAIARKIVSKKHWGALVRTMSRSGSFAGPVSWTGTMFEYYMPHLLLPVYDGSLLGEAMIYCLYCHKKRVRGTDAPWGISESAYYAFDNNLNYQYKAHGVQKVGVKRYLDRELVISPYSTFITIPFNPNSSMDNLRRLRQLGVYGRYGFYEAVDFTPERVKPATLAVARSYMAHHIGMSMISSCNALFDMRMQKRFMRDRYMQSANEFLQEKIAKNAVIYDALNSPEARWERAEKPRLREESSTILPQAPRCVLLSNGELTDILTDTGAGYLKFGDLDLTRRSADLLRRAQGLFVLAQMQETVLCATKAPFFDPNAQYQVEQQKHCVTYFAKKENLELGMRCLLHPTISCAQRQIVIKNTSSAKQRVEVLVYLEPILCTYEDYSAHPAYSKLFVSSRYDEGTKTLVFTRRGRDSTNTLYLTAGFLQDLDYTFETRREAVLSAPNGYEDLLHFAQKPLAGGSHGVPDACCALRFSVVLAPGAQQQVTLLLSAAHTEAESMGGMISMRKLGALEPKHAAVSPLLDDSLEGRLGSNILGPLLFNHQMAGDLEDRARNTLGQSGLWGMGISGDLPIVLIDPSDRLEDSALESSIRLHTTLRSLGIAFDLVMLYDAESQNQHLLDLVKKNGIHNILGVRGGIFVLCRKQLLPESLTLLRAVARHVAHDGVLLTESMPVQEYTPIRMLPCVAFKTTIDPQAVCVHGGYFLNERFYVRRTSPLPYSHVLSNCVFGTLVSDTSLGFTWAINSRENRLTPWYNDISTDNRGEICLVRDGGRYYDLTNGALASFSAQDAQYQGICGELDTCVRVSVSDKGFAKYIDVTITNRSGMQKGIECAYYTEPVLGVTRDTARYIRPTMHGNVLVLHNAYNTAVHCYASLYAKHSKARYTTDRTAFLCGDWKQNEVSVQNDPCAAVIVPLHLAPDESVQLRFTLAYGENEKSATQMPLLDLTTPPAPTNQYTIDTPDVHLNAYINTFAPHQILHSRIWGRCAFYQCGGAYGFRDQLQDVSAYMLIDPEIARRQILRCCEVQFEEGDVLHWWHPLPENAGGLRGVRTRFSDDLLWLPLVVSDYVQKTGDTDLLDIQVGYLHAPKLPNAVHEQYIAPTRSALTEDVFSHCIRAIEKGYNIDEKGLPRIGCGDWNDGFSSVGLDGKGTSVWLALFLSIVLTNFGKICALRGREDLQKEYKERAEALRRAVDEHCWDGKWYLRAFYDDGSKMGTHENTECAIDLLPQSFAVLAGMPDVQRVRSGLESAWKHLVREDLRLVQLFDRPFQHSEQQPGYIKAYPQGIRENGGQYTHAAIWFAIALLRAGKFDKGWKVLQMINPVDRATHPELAEVYKVEPYYMAADIYTNEHAPGRGGWTLYTGAASWYYRAILEGILGLRLRGDTVYFRPRLPSDWPEARLTARIASTTLHVRIRRGHVQTMLCDGMAAEHIPLDGGTYQVEVIL